MKLSLPAGLYTHIPRRGGDAKKFDNCVFMRIMKTNRSTNASVQCSQQRCTRSALRGLSEERRTHKKRAVTKELDNCRRCGQASHRNLLGIIDVEETARE